MLRNHAAVRNLIRLDASAILFFAVCGTDVPQILLYAHFKRKEQFDYEYEIYDCAVLFY